MSTLQIRQRLEALLDFMQPHWKFVNCHMVSYFKDNHWQNFVPPEMRAEVSDAEKVVSCIETAFWGIDSKNGAIERFPAFTHFLSVTRLQCLHNFQELLVTLPRLRQLLGTDQIVRNMSIKEFMSEKKRHEVEITAEVINDLIQKCIKDDAGQDMFVIDAGDGKGYLSSRLALQYGLKVLGIDCNEMNTENALERNRKLQRVWNGLLQRAELLEKGVSPPTRSGKKSRAKNSALQPSTCSLDTCGTYKTTSKFINPELDVVSLLREFFPMEKPTNSLTPVVCLTGLHTCGNLAPTSLKLFQSQPQCKILCNIGCCYHLLKEAYSDQEHFNNSAMMDMQTEVGFPMSRFLQEKRVKLGRNARMLAAQSIERTLHAKELPSATLFYRALLEILLCKKDEQTNDSLQVGKVRKFGNFKEYVNSCAMKASHECSQRFGFSNDEIEELESHYQKDKNYLSLFYLLRMSFAPVLESLILLDRLLYLKECGFEDSYLVSLFDAVISPRHFAVIALKK